VRDVESGRTDYTSAAFTPSAVERLQRLYGAGGRFTAGGRNGIRYLVLNASRPTFANQTVRRAVSLAVDRTALVGLQSQYNSDFGHPPFEKPTSDLLPGDVPGYLPGHVYPLRSDLAAARRLMAGRRLSAVLYSCSAAPCPQQAAVITANLAAIGITVTTKVLAKPVIFQQLGAKRPGYDIVVFGWVPDYPDPENVLVPLLDGRALNTPDGVDFAHFNDPSVNRRLEAAARLSGARRFHDFGQLAIDLAREGVPLVAFAAESDDAFYAAGVECRIDQPVYGPDLAALCRR